jgi:hypothetical protein
MDEPDDTIETARWAHEQASRAPDELVRAFAERVGAMHFRARAVVLDAALSGHPALGTALVRSMRGAIDDDGVRATLESLPLATLAHVLCALSREPDAAFALALAAWPGPLSCVSVARTHPDYPGDEALRQSLLAVVAGPYRASARVRAIYELVAMGGHRATIEGVAATLDDTVHDLRTTAVRALARLRATRPLLGALDSPHATVRADARMMLVQLVNRREAPRDEVLAAFELIASDARRAPRERFESRRALRELGESVERVPWSGLHQDAADSLAHEINSLANRLAIHEYVSVLADADDPRATEAVREALARPAKVARALAGFRAFFKGPHGAKALKVLARDRDPLVRERAAELSKMRG